MIVYFTGTGNSRYCAKFLAHHLDEELINANRLIQQGIAADLVSGRPWIFVSPTYAWQIPRIFADFIRGGAFHGSKDAYFVMTCGSDIGNAAAWIEPVCQSAGLRFRGVLPVVMPENYVAMFDVPDERESAEIIQKARPVLREAVQMIRMGEDFPEVPVDLQGKAKSGKINQIFYRKFVKAKDFRVTDACVGCFRCVKYCVMNNIHFENHRPVWGDQCTHCMACICGCPKSAIEYGNKTRGKPRYQCQDFTG